MVSLPKTNVGITMSSFLLIVHLLLQVLQVNGKIPALFVFGDSTVDPGNNNHISTILKSDFEPYCRDFEGGKPTGRFSNGRIATDFIAEAFGIKSTVPAYLDPAYDIKDFATGVSFASAGSGFDNATSDVLLHQRGAQKITITGLPPMGCLPLERATNIFFGSYCIEEYNNVAKDFNEKLSEVVTDLNKNLPAIQAVLSSPYDMVMEMIDNPTRFGFKNAAKACCGTGLFEMSYMCNKRNPFTCSDASEYIFWDSFHPTEKTNKIVADYVVRHFLSRFK
ncbi:GDSL esterase/lipase At4g26790 [Linum perenne]